MSDRTGIEWTDRTWNPVRGCSRVSEGCRNCYAERFAQRFVGGYMDGFVANSRWTGRVELVPEKLAEPLSWRNPSRVFVNSMSDLFHEGLQIHEIDRVFAAMAAAPQHAFQVLTKRPERMRSYVNNLGRLSSVAGFVAVEHRRPQASMYLRWPLPNVWLGVSVEDQASADERIPHLLATPAAVRFISYEPALGPVDFARVPVLGSQTTTSRSGLDWVIVGGESGPGARPCRTDWLRDVVAQCRGAGVPVFVKQLGSCSLSSERQLWEEAGCPEEWSASERRPDVFLRRRLESKGGDPAYWPDDLCVREFPEPRP